MMVMSMVGRWLICLVFLSAYFKLNLERRMGGWLVVVGSGGGGGW